MFTYHKLLILKILPIGGMLIAASLLYGETRLNNAQYEAEIVVPQEQCLQVIGTYRAGGNTWQLRFFNACGKKIYANACVEERPGKFRLHKSGGKIPEGGYWNLFSYEGRQPLSVAVSTASGQPPVPGECKG